MKRLKLGYVSPDFRIHSAAFLFSPVVWGHDRSRFEVYCYSSVMQRDGMTAKHGIVADHWVECYGMSDDELGAQLKADGIDIAIDLAGHTAQTRLGAFAKRMAPVQVSGWGYLAAPGIPEIDWHFADPVLIPFEERHHYVEKIWDLPSTMHYISPDGCPDVAPLPALKNGYVTFGYLGRWSKVTQPVIDVWASILRAVPSARLLLKDKAFDVVARRDAVRAQFGDVSSRLDFAGVTGHLQQLEAYSRVDVALDPWPAGGGVTVLEALWMGVPTITMLGDRPSCRAGASIMTVARLSEFIGLSVDEYYRCAQAHAHYCRRSPAARSELRQGARAKMLATPLADTVAYIQAVEAAYLKMWELRDDEVV